MLFRSINGMTAVECLPNGILVFRNDNEVHMVAHQTICTNAQMVSAAVFLKQIQIGKVILFIHEDVEPPNSTLSDMVCNTRQNYPSISSHILWSAGDLERGCTRKGKGTSIWSNGHVADKQIIRGASLEFYREVRTGVSGTCSAIFRPYASRATSFRG